MRPPIDPEQIAKAIAETNSLSEAALLLNVSYSTFARQAAKLGFKGNQGKSGSSKPWTDARKNKVDLDEVLSNKKYIPSCKLKDRLFAAGLKKNECERCGISEWQGKRITCQLDHRDGNKYNNQLENLDILCPNCHSQTPTYCRGQGKYASVAKLVDAPRLGRDVR